MFSECGKDAAKSKDKMTLSFVISVIESFVGPSTVMVDRIAHDYSPQETERKIRFLFMIADLLWSETKEF